MSHFKKMEGAAFESELHDLIVLVLSYASDFFQIKEIKDKKLIAKDGQAVDPRIFRNKCHEGFKKAQNLIIPSLLQLEKEIRIKDNLLKEYQKGKHKRDLRNDEFNEKTEDELFELRIQKQALKRVADVIVWYLLRFEKTYIKAFMVPGMHSGYLEDRDIRSVVEAAGNYNINDDAFALVSDITTVIGVGDLLVVDEKGRLAVSEVGGGPKNDKVQEILDKVFNTEDPKPNLPFWASEYKKADDHFRGHLLRKTKQLARSISVIDYLNNDEGYDFTLKTRKRVTTLETQEKRFLEEMNFVLNDPQRWKKYPFLFPLDCIIVGISNRSNYPSFRTCEWDFKHHLYHLIVKPWKECQYSEEFKMEEVSDFENFEFTKYFSIPTHGFLQSLFIPVLVPMYIIFKPNYVVDIITRKISINVYFDVDRFEAICKERGLGTEWVDKRTYHQQEKRGGFEPPG